MMAATGENIMAHPRTPIGLLGIGLIAGLGVVDIPALGQTPQAPREQSATTAPGSDPDARAPYPVGMGEIMAFGVQPRHLTLAAAARAGDWGYAAYALKELGETYERIPRAIPSYQGQRTTDLVGSFSKEPMTALDQAIKASDPARFKAAYAQLTQSCNACHEKTGRGMVVIRVPDSADALADQEFKPSKP
jgi:mono/diheme cytochrome c family protein